MFSRSPTSLASAAPSLGDWFQNKKGAQAENEGLIRDWDLAPAPDH